MRLQKSFYLLLAAGWLAAACPLFGGETDTWRIVPPAKAEQKLPQLPPLTVVARRDDSGQTWGIEGSLGGTRAVALQDFQACFERQGWRLDKVISIGKDPRGDSLILWRRGAVSIFLKLHEAGVATTEFALGVDRQPTQLRREVANNLSPAAGPARKNFQSDQKP